jgi:hypothetical protein
MDNVTSIKRADEPGVRDLRQAITDIDEIANHACEQIQAISSVSACVLKSPHHVARDADIASTLGVVIHLAADLANTINSMAEDLGCNHVGQPPEITSHE